MKNRIILVLFILVASLGGILYLTLQSLCESKSDVTRLRANQELLHFKNDSLSKLYTGVVNSYEALRVEKEEFEDLNQDLTKTLKSMDIKLKNASRVAVSSVSYDCVFKVDTIYVHDTIHSESKLIFNYSDPWLRFQMDSVARISIQDTIVEVQHMKCKRFLWWRWNKHYKTSYLHTNPYIKITNQVEYSIN